MKILVTGAKGFIGKNLIAELKNSGYDQIFEFTKENNIEELEKYTKDCDFVFHLAGVNRAINEKDFQEGNINLTKKLIELLEKNKNNCPILFTSSIQSKLDNVYGKTKRQCEKIILQHASKTNTIVYIYRLTNIFGKWCKPNYNSVVANFCYNIANDLPIQIENKNKKLELIYIDDVIEDFILRMEENLLNRLKQKEIELKTEHFYKIEKSYFITVKKLAETINIFDEQRKNLIIPDLSDELIKKLYSTYLSYLPISNLKRKMKANTDERGIFSEILKSKEAGQISINVTKPGIVRGNHWHHTKIEKFLVVSGRGVIKLRNLNTNDMIEFFVNGDDLEIIDIPVGYVHNIENLGSNNMITLIWANEIFDPEKPDTFGGVINGKIEINDNSRNKT